MRGAFHNTMDAIKSLSGSTTIKYLLLLLFPITIYTIDDFLYSIIYLKTTEFILYADHK